MQIKSPNFLRDYVSLNLRQFEHQYLNVMKAKYPKEIKEGKIGVRETRRWKKLTWNKGEDGKIKIILGSSLHVLSLLNHFPVKIWSVYLWGLRSDGGRRKKRVNKKLKHIYISQVVWNMFGIFMQ